MIEKSFSERKVKLELDSEPDLVKNIPYAHHLETLHMCVSGQREITIENPYNPPRIDNSIDRHKENLIADKFKALLTQKYPEDSEWEIKWIRSEWDNHSQTVKR